MEEYRSRVVWSTGNFFWAWQRSEARGGRVSQYLMNQIIEWLRALPGYANILNFISEKILSEIYISFLLKQYQSVRE